MLSLKPRPFVQRLRGGGCNKFVPVLRGDATIIGPTGGIFDQASGGISLIRGKLADHVEDHVVLSPGGAVLVTSRGRNRRIPALPNR